MIMALRRSSVSDTNVLRAMESVPRRHFVPDRLWDKAYDEKALPIACGQSISSPLTVARLTQLIDPRRDHKLLEIGTGSGYHAAVLSKMVTRVYSMERYHQLLAEAEARFAKVGINNVVTRHGDGRYGWKGQAPFDRILITAEVKTIPKALKDQLKPGGMIAAVSKGEMIRVTKTEDGFKTEKIYPMSLPPIETGKSKVL